MNINTLQEALDNAIALVDYLKKMEKLLSTAPNATGEGSVRKKKRYRTRITPVMLSIVNNLDIPAAEVSKQTGLALVTIYRYRKKNNITPSGNI